jgi:hypothetical protein
MGNQEFLKKAKSAPKNLAARVPEEKLWEHEFDRISSQSKKATAETTVAS